MSRLWVRALLCAALLAALAGGAIAGAAGASSFEALVQNALAPSAAPALLGPITEAGRTGWACKPERAASARNWREAALPGAADP